MAVKSYIFNSDKGFGITIGGKKEKGYSRYTTCALRIIIARTTLVYGSNS